jgi:hypothetical protein
MVMMVIALMMVVLFAMAATSTMPMHMAGQHLSSLQARQIAESVLEEFRFRYVSGEQLAMELTGFCLQKPPQTKFDVSTFTGPAIWTGDGHGVPGAFATMITTTNGSPGGTLNGFVDVHWGKGSGDYYSTDNHTQTAATTDYLGQRIPPYSIDLIINVEVWGGVQHYEALLTQVWPYAVFSTSGMVLRGGTKICGEVATAAGCGPTSTPGKITLYCTPSPAPTWYKPICPQKCCWIPRILKGAAVIWPETELANLIKAGCCKTKLACKYVVSSYPCGCCPIGLCPVKPCGVELEPLSTDSRLVNSKGTLKVGFPTCGTSWKPPGATNVKWLRGRCNGCAYCVQLFDWEMRNCGYGFNCKVYYIKCGVSRTGGTWKTCGSIVNYEPTYPKCCNCPRARGNWCTCMAPMPCTLAKCCASTTAANCNQHPWSPKAKSSTKLPCCCRWFVKCYGCCVCPCNKCGKYYMWHYTGKHIKLKNTTWVVYGNMDLVSHNGVAVSTGCSCCCFPCVKGPTICGCNSTLYVRGSLRIMNAQIGSGPCGLVIIANDIDVEGGGCFHGTLVALRDLRIQPMVPSNKLKIKGAIIARGGAHLVGGTPPTSPGWAQWCQNCGGKLTFTGSKYTPSGRITNFKCQISLTSTCVRYDVPSVKALNALDSLYLTTWRQLP